LRGIEACPAPCDDVVVVAFGIGTFRYQVSRLPHRFGTWKSNHHARAVDEVSLLNFLRPTYHPVIVVKI